MAQAFAVDHWLSCMMASDLESRVCALTGASRVAHRERIQPLWGGYGEIVRMHLQGAASNTVVVKWVRPPKMPRSCGETPETRSHRRKLQSYAVEHAWYLRYADRVRTSARVPLFHGGISLEDGWLFVLEDLDAAGLSRRIQCPSDVEIAAGLRWLASFHACFMGETPQGLWQQGTYWHLQTRPDELAAVRDPKLRELAPLLDARLRSCRYSTLIHGDAKIENFCFAGGGYSTEIAALDFQYVGGGCGMKDVAYFLYSGLEPAACEAHAQRYTTMYFQYLRAALSRRRPELDAGAIEGAWGDLTDLAWADFYRFLAGWSPYEARAQTYAKRAVERAQSLIGAPKL